MGDLTKADLICLMAASIYRDEGSNVDFQKRVAANAVDQALLIWDEVLKRGV
jgi:hypothetical protein